MSLKINIPSQLIELKAKEVANDFEKDVLQGLSSNPKTIPSRYFYDEKGSRLFEDIMELPEYYLTDCEWDIFQRSKDEILHQISGVHFHLIDLGAGDAKKTRILLEHFMKQGADFSYVPVDISKDILDELLVKLNDELPDLHVEAIAGEYFDALDWIKQNMNGRKVILFMGSNIGNFNKTEAISFLCAIRNMMDENDYLLTGLDLKKDPQTILNAYYDSKGVTSAFNYNLLNRINRELGGNFSLDNWKHHASYDPISGAVKSFLVSMKEQDVILGNDKQCFHFKAFEAIHTEYSFKYDLEELAEMASKSGFTIVANYLSKVERYIDSLWHAAS